MTAVIAVFTCRIICPSILVSSQNHSKEKSVRAAQQIALALLVFVLIAAPVRADGIITPFVGFNFGGDSASTCVSLSNCTDKRMNLGVSLTSMGPVFGLEEDISYAKNFFGETPGGDNSVLSLMTNLVAGVGVGPVRPYLLAGIGLIRPHVTLSGAFAGLGETGKNALGYDYGGGLTLMFGSHVGVRGDLRQFRTVRNVNVFIFTGQKLDFWRASGGLALVF
jgi:hypothetical protein